MYVLLKTETDRFVAVFEDCCAQGEVAPVLSDVPKRRGPRIPIHVQKDLAHHEWHVDVKPIDGSYREEYMGRFLAHTLEATGFKTGQCILHDNRA